MDDTLLLLALSPRCCRPGFRVLASPLKSGMEFLLSLVGAPNEDLPGTIKKKSYFWDGGVKKRRDLTGFVNKSREGRSFYGRSDVM